MIRMQLLVYLMCRKRSSRKTRKYHRILALFNLYDPRLELEAFNCSSTITTYFTRLEKGEEPFAFLYPCILLHAKYH